MEGDKLLLKSILRVTAPVLTAVAAAYILYPPVAAVKKRVKSRRLACVLVFALIFAPLLAVLLYAFCSLRSEGGGSAAEGLLLYINMFTRRINSAYFRLCELSDRAGCKFIRHYLDEMVRGTQLPAAELVKRLSSALLDIMLGMVMAFYLLTDEDAAEEARRVAGVLLPKRVYSGLTRICGDIDAVFSVVSRFSGFSDVSVPAVIPAVSSSLYSSVIMSPCNQIFYYFSRNHKPRGGRNKGNASGRPLSDIPGFFSGK